MTLKAIYAGAVSQEAISYQGGKSMLLHDLTFAFQNFIQAGAGHWNQKGMDALNLSRIVQKHTGLNIDFKLMLDECNAFAMPPLMDVNSPLMDRFRVMGYNQTEDYGDMIMGLKKVSSFTKELRGSIDRNNGRVTGVFSKILTSITVGSGLWNSAKCTPEEVAAITLHEIGHVFTYLECLMQTATLNMVLASATQALAKTTEMDHRLQLVYETEDALGIKLEDKEGVARAGLKADAYHAIFLKSAMDPKLQSAAGSHTYDLRSSEFLADQFAARYGAGRSLVIALDKMYKFMGAGHRFNTATWVAIEAVKGAVIIMHFVATPVAAAVLYTLLLIVGNPEARVYDDPAERLTRIKHDLVQSLKDNSLPLAARDQLLADIKMVEQVMVGVADRRTFFNYLWLACTSKRRDQFSQMRFQQEIEKLVNNDFFVKAHQFKTLA